MYMYIYIYMHIHTYIHMCVCVCLYIYIYVSCKWPNMTTKDPLPFGEQPTAAVLRNRIGSSKSKSSDTAHRSAGS